MSMSSQLPTMGHIEAAPQTSSPRFMLSALLLSSGFAPLESLGWIRVTGEDRVRWLNGMVTNSIQTLKPGEGCYNFVLSAQGRIHGDLTAFLLEDSILLQTGRDRIPALLALLDRFIIMDDVELADESGEFVGLLLAGPGASALLRDLDLLDAPPAPLSLSVRRFRGRELWLVHAHSPLVPRYELLSDPETLALLSESLSALGATSAGAEALEHLRILEGTPLYGTDIRERELPQETATVAAPSRALHFSKGCYLGQEIVERIRSRGNVHRTFSGFVLSGDLPAAGASLISENDPTKPIGELTSVASVALPSGDVLLGIGYVRREALDRSLRLRYQGGSAEAAALPFLAAAALTAPAAPSPSD